MDATAVVLIAFGLVFSELASIAGCPQKLTDIQQKIIESFACRNDGHKPTVVGRDAR